MPWVLRTKRRLVPLSLLLSLSWNTDTSDDMMPRRTTSQACKRKTLLWVSSHSLGPGWAPLPHLPLAKGVCSPRPMQHQVYRVPSSRGPPLPQGPIHTFLPYQLPPLSPVADDNSFLQGFPRQSHSNPPYTL